MSSAAFRSKLHDVSSDFKMHGYTSTVHVMRVIMHVHESIPFLGPGGIYTNKKTYIYNIYIYI